VFFEKITQKISTFKPLPIFILSVLSSFPKARLSKNKIFIVFRFSSVTDKTTQNKKDTREVSRIFYSAIAPFNGTKRFEFLLEKKDQYGTLTQSCALNDLEIPLRMFIYIQGNQPTNDNDS